MVPVQSPEAGAGGVGVAVGVAVGVGVGVGPNNCPGPQLEINKLPDKIQTNTVRCWLFMIQSPALSRFMEKLVLERDQSAYLLP